MNDMFERRVRTAAVAGWRSLMIVAGVFLLAYVVYLPVIAAHPAWLLSMFGPGMSWHEVQNVWLWAMAAFKIFLWCMATVALWLTLWARQLRTHG
jgi:hypothetical protein